nr:hypothetical protein [Tanacetum cinerariifolium]
EGSGTPIEPHHTPSPEAPQSPQHDHSSSIHPPDLEISTLKARIKLLEDRDGGGDDPSGEEATIKGRSLEIGEEAGIERSTDKGSNDTDEIVNVLTSLDAAKVATVSIPPAGEIPTVSVPTGSGVVPTASLVFTTTTVATPYSRRKEEELQILRDSVDRTNEIVAKYLQEYEQFAVDLDIGERIELINDLVKYQNNYAKVLKYQSQQRKPLSKKQQREFYMLVLRSHARWKSKHFKGMSLEEIREKFVPVWKQIEDFVPLGSKEEGERFKRKGLRKMLHICPRLLAQTFDEPPFEEEILAFLRSLGHSGEIRRLTDVNINKLHQPWRSFAAVNWHYVRDDQMFMMIKLVSRHQNTQQFGAMFPIELTNADIKNSDAYTEYYVVATGATPSKTKASVRKTKSKEFIHLSLSTHDEEETRDEESFDLILKTPKNTDDEGNGEENLGMNVSREEGQDEEDEEDELYKDVNINLGRCVQMADVYTTQEFEDSHVTLTPINPDGQQQSSSVSSQFVTSMLKSTPDARIKTMDTTIDQQVVMDKALVPTA